MIKVGSGDLNVHLTVEFPKGRGAHRPLLFPPIKYIHTQSRDPVAHTLTVRAHTESLGTPRKIALIYYCHTPSTRPLGSAGALPKHVFHRQCHTITS